jgi:hypothetical protein
MHRGNDPINLVGALIYLGGEAGLMQVVRNGVASITNFSLTPIPFFVLMGEVLFHTGLAMKAIDAFDRAIRGVPPLRPGTRAAVGATTYGGELALTCLCSAVSGERLSRPAATEFLGLLGEELTAFL